MLIKKLLVILAFSFFMSVAAMYPENLFASDEPFIFGLLLVGPHNDHGLSQTHYEGGKYVVQKVPGTKMIYIDKVNPTDRPGVTITQLVDDMVEKGAKLIISNSADMKNGIREAAIIHQDIYFLQISGDAVMSEKGSKNLSNLLGRMEYGKMMAGFAAAMTTKTGKIGYLGSLVNEETRRLASSCYLGAKFAWENVLKKSAKELKFQVTWIGFWFNIPGVTADPSQISNNFFNTGYDVVISDVAPTKTTSVAKQKYQEGKSVWTIPYNNIGACESATDVCLGVPYFNWGPGYVEFVKAAMSDNWKPKWLWMGPDWNNINNPDTTAVGFFVGPALSAPAKRALDGFIKDLGSGKINLFKGPLNYQDGTPFVKAGKIANDKQIWYMEQLLEGMTGQSTAK
jgi:simple sugar transport system substrate-binding protein